MFWAACTLDYFGFPQSAEFTVPNLASFSPAIHLSITDIPVDSSISLTSMHVRIKASKMYTFYKGCFVHIGRGSAPMCTPHFVALSLYEGQLTWPPLSTED